MPNHTEQEIKEAVEVWRDGKNINGEHTEKCLGFLLSLAQSYLDIPGMPKEKKGNYTVCSICRAGDGLHQFETNKCPKNGREAPIGKIQEWADTVFTTTATKDYFFNQALHLCKLAHLKEVEELKHRIQELYHHEADNFTLKRKISELQKEIERLKG